VRAISGSAARRSRIDFVVSCLTISMEVFFRRAKASEPQSVSQIVLAHSAIIVKKPAITALCRKPCPEILSTPAGAAERVLLCLNLFVRASMLTASRVGECPRRPVVHAPGPNRESA
jgi:hypothetical protein